MTSAPAKKLAVLLASVVLSVGVCYAPAFAQSGGGGGGGPAGADSGRGEADATRIETGRHYEGRA